MNRYPTREEILSADVKHKPEVLRAVKLWKRHRWIPALKLEDAEERRCEKTRAIAALLAALSNYYDKPVNLVVATAASTSSFYRPATRTIHLHGSPSIITALHELGHHLFGRSELKACRWSVHLFIKIFPKAYEKLEWDGHMLKRRTG
jgi:hypothetical protein